MKFLRSLMAVLAALTLGAALCGPALAATPTAPATSSASPPTDRSAAGDAVCTRCHDQAEAKPVLAIQQTPHGQKADGRTPGCQSCHGASLAHVKNADNAETRPPADISYGAKVHTSAAQQGQACLSCHQGGARNGRSHWAGSQHQGAGMACSSCHAVHVKKDPVLVKTAQPEVCFSCHKSERAQAHRVSTHPLAAGKMACSDCHNPHGSTGPALMKKGSVNETCWSCHADKRGPFLWEHEPVTEACTTCHTPHGSNISPLLKARTPFLCQSCHSGDHAAQVNSGANLGPGAVSTARGANPLANAPARAQLGGKNCQACHFQTHGSNHPSGSKLLR